MYCNDVWKVREKLLLLLSRIHIHPQVCYGKREHSTRAKEAAAFLVTKKQPDHFGSVSENELEKMAQFKMPNNSAQASKWAMKNLGDWVEDQSEKTSTSVVYKDYVVNMYSSPSSLLPPFPAQYPQYSCYLPYPPVLPVLAPVVCS